VACVAWCGSYGLGDDVFALRQMSRALLWEASLVISPGKDFYEGLDMCKTSGAASCRTG
jgi:hypothetical protein